MTSASIAREDVLRFKTLGLLGDIFQLSMKMRKEGIALLPLHLGDPARFDFPPLPSFVEGIRKALDKPLSYSYGNPQGYPPLLERIAELEGASPDYVFTGNGVSDMMDKFLNAIALPGSNVLLPAPVFSPYLDICTKFNIQNRLYRCDPGTWRPMLSSIEEKLDDSTSLILVNSPNNPTGAVYTEDDLRGIIELAHETNLARRRKNLPPLCLLFDEIYSEHYFDQKPPDVRPMLKDKEVSWIIFNGASKAFNATGLRVGYAVLGGAGRETLRSALYNECILPLCMNSLFQEGYLAALCDPARESYFAGVREKLRRRRDMMIEAFAKIPGVSAVKPGGAFYMIVRMETTFANDRELGLALLSEEKICTSQMSAFFDAETHPAGAAMLRLVILPQEEVLADALARFGQFMRRYGRVK